MHFTVSSDGANALASLGEHTWISDNVAAKAVRMTLLRTRRVTYFEAAETDDAIVAALREDEEPFGTVCWPAAVAAANCLARYSEARGGLRGLRVLELGAGTGVASLAAHALGATVVATDVADLSLRLLGLARGALEAGSEDRFAALRLDLMDEGAVARVCEERGPFDVVVACDMLYFPELARAPDCVARASTRVEGVPQATARAVAASRARMRLVLDPGRAPRSEFVAELVALEGAEPVFRPVEVDVEIFRLAGRAAETKPFPYDGCYAVGFGEDGRRCSVS